MTIILFSFVKNIKQWPLAAETQTERVGFTLFVLVVFIRQEGRLINALAMCSCSCMGGLAHLVYTR